MLQSKVYSFSRYIYFRNFQFLPGIVLSQVIQSVGGKINWPIYGQCYTSIFDERYALFVSGNASKHRCIRRNNNAILKRYLHWVSRGMVNFYY